MRRTILLLTSALIVFLATLIITNNYMTNESIKEADRINDLLVQNVRTQMDVGLVIRQKSVHSFLSGILKYDITEENGVLDTTVIIPEKEVPGFRSKVYNVLEGFMKLNPHILNALFVIDSSVYEGTSPYGFAPCIKSGDSIHYNLAEKYDFMKSKTYKILRESTYCLWRLPHVGSPIRGKTVAYSVPIYRESGDFFGYFAIDINLERLRNRFIDSLPYGKNKSAVIIADENNEIIFSTDSFYNKLGKITDIAEAFADDNTFKKEASDSIHHDIYAWQGHKHFVYQSNMTIAPWHAITICSENAVYDGVKNTRNVILLVSLIGMLIMLACCLIVFRQVRHNLQQKLAVENELNMAAKVQMSMLKPKQFKIQNSEFKITLNAFIRPAREAGGDLYDYIEVDGKLIFCIGDVSGKGMAAALFMSQVVSLFRNAVRFSLTPEKILYDMNNVLSENNPDMTFCTCIVGIVDGDSLTYCNAGHNHPVIIPSSGETQYLKPHSNVALGLMEDFIYQPDFIPFHAGDCLFLYTDGVTEAMNFKHEQYDEPRLLETLTNNKNSQNLCSTINDSVKKFVGDAPQSDDITIVTITKY